MGAGGSGGAAAQGFAAGDPGRPGDEPGFDFRGVGTAERIAIADADDGCSESEQDPACAHGEYKPADHAGRHASRFSESGPAERQSNRDGAQSATSASDDRRGDGSYRRIKSE